ncbi:hypothetical protein JCM16774_2055 [Pseudoleptotrichia goodfellowii]|uniref:Uncharacterized protein n=1 Tax=Pseudoleptotrichia goodfellowii TaxID=157692 RepID=A0A510JGP1_9FUSO|nr:hypothetical protein JCM16774_2055 [Pseudoleptotrichia goodfellowii]
MYYGTKKQEKFLNKILLRKIVFKIILSKKTFAYTYKKCYNKFSKKFIIYIGGNKYE